MKKSSLPIIVLVAVLITSNGWWALREFSRKPVNIERYNITTMEACNVINALATQVSVYSDLMWKHHAELAPHECGLIKEEIEAARKRDIVKMAGMASPNIAPEVRDGVTWIGNLGLVFDGDVLFEAIVDLPGFKIQRHVKPGR